MHNTKLFLLTCILLLAACDSQQLENTNVSSLDQPKQLAKIIFTSLKTNNYQYSNSYFINKSDLDYFFSQQIKKFNKNKKRYGERLKKTIAKKEKSLKKFPVLRQQKLSLVNKSLAAIRAKAIKEGIDWGESKYVGTHLENTRSNYGIPYTDILITIASGNTNIVIRVPNSPRFKRGWIFTEAPVWEGKAKNE